MISDQISQLRNQLHANRDDWGIRYNLIYALHEAGQTDEAVDLLSEIEELPSDDISIVYAAQCYQILGATEQAASVFETALQLNPENAAAQAGLQSLHFEAAALETTPDSSPLASGGAALAEEITPPPKITADDITDLIPKEPVWSTISMKPKRNQNDATKHH